MDDMQKIETINDSVCTYFANNTNHFCKPNDLMPYLIDKGLFNKNHRNGLPLRNLLRRWDDDSNIIKLIPSIRVERKKKNRYWFFDRK